MQIGKLLAGCVRASDTVARLGGDEFVFLLDDLTSSEEVLRVTERILQSLKSPLKLRAQPSLFQPALGLSWM